MRTVFVICLLFCTSCVSQKPWAYRASPPSDAPLVVDATLAIGPMTDRRPTDNSDMRAMGYVPLLPYGWIDLEQPEGAQRHTTSGLWMWRPNEDLAKAAAEEFANSGVFRESFFTNRPSEGDYQLRSTLHRTYFEGKEFTYLLSFVGVYLWIVGLPATSAENTLDIEFDLISPSGAKVWSKRYVRTDGGKLSWLYSMNNDFTYPDLASEMLTEAVADVRNHFTSATR